MNKILFFICALLMLSSNAFAQRNCGTMEHLHQLEQIDPGLSERMQKIENHTKFMISQDASGVAKNANLIVIPVVVHVVYRTASENISDAQIQSQIQVLNEDFRRLNADASQTLSQFQGVAADAEVEFCLASIAPNGTATNGITRTSTTNTTFGTNNSVKFNSQGGKDAWPAGQYMNFWICNIGGGILGYAQFPGGSAATDGIVCDYRYVGTSGTATAPFNKGRTATHEVGHYLNLRHIWGDGNCSQDDFVTDTPPSSSANYGCALTTVKCNTLDMVQNYMDYSNDACMNIYTSGQKARMRALFGPGGARASLLSSNGCGSSTPTCSDGIQNGTETGVDCGGSCPACPPASACLSYCISRGNSTADEFIQSVTIGSYTNNSGNNSGYASFTTGNSYQRGTGYSLTLVPGWTGTIFAEYFRIWADWNGDGDFADAGELAFDQGSASTAAQVNGSITVPTGAALGNTTFRVQMKYNAASTNCETFSWGEVEDYCVQITAGAATCAIPAGLNTSGLTATTVTLNWQAVSGATSYNVRTRALGATSWSTGIVTGTSANFTGLTACLGYEFQVQSVCASGSSAYSTSVNFITPGCASCTAPSVAYVDNITSSSARFVWSAMPNATNYTLRFRLSGTTTWTTVNNASTSITRTGLLCNSTYEYRIRTRCGSTWTAYGTIRTFTTNGCNREEESLITETANSSQFEMYPNPANDLLNISFTESESEEFVLVRIFDMSGRLVIERNAQANEGSNLIIVETTELVSGIYLVQMRNGSFVETKRLVVTK